MRSFGSSFSALCRVMMAALCLIAWRGPVHADEVRDVYMWVADELQIDSVPDMPSVHFVDKESLHAAFKEGNQAAISHWVEQYGEDQAHRIMTHYLQGMQGLFISNSESIYIFALLPPCRRRSVLAHEFTHFFQFLTDGEISLDQYDSDILHLMREMKAYQIEKKYLAGYCSDYENVVF